MTAFHYAGYLSDLGVHREFQKKGIGKRLQIISQGVPRHIEWVDASLKRCSWGE